MYLYKWIYRGVAVVVLMAGLVCAPFIKYIITNQTESWAYLYTIYFLQLSSVVFGYFLSYRRTIYIADQKAYKCVRIDLYTEAIILITQIVLLILVRNYLLYLSVQLFGKLLSNVIIARGTSKEYPYLNKKYIVSKEDIKRRDFIPDVKNFLVHKISYVIYGGTDNIIISAFCGVRDVALYGNYFLLQSGVLGVLLYKLLDPVQATLGKVVYSKRSKIALWEQFNVLDVFSFFFASYISTGFLTFFQSAILIWLGSSEYLLPYSFVVAYSLTIYLGAVWEIICKYRSVFGDYRQDRNCMLLSALLNIVISVALVKPLGVTGVQIGTLFAFLPIAYGRIRFVVRGFFGQSVKKYLIKHTFLFGVVLVESTLIYFLTFHLPVTIMGLFLRAVVWTVVPLAFGLLIYFRDSHFKDMCSYFVKLLEIVKNKINGKNAR